MKNIKYGERLHRTRVLGPGERSVIWAFGCCFSCEDCIADRFKKGEYLEASPEEMAQWFLSDEKVSHLTVSGGEPMLQAGQLYEAVRLIRQSRDTGVIVYTGFHYEELIKMSEKDMDIKNFLSVIDILIDGPYEKEKDNNRAYIGSDNQRIILLSDRYKDVYEEYYLSRQGRETELILKRDKSLLVGVPGKKEKELWQKLKEVAS